MAWVLNESLWLLGSRVGRSTRRKKQEVRLGVRHKVMVTWTRVEAVEVGRNNRNFHVFWRHRQ